MRVALGDCRGIQFLQHVESYLLDGTDDPIHQYSTLKHELTQYNDKLPARHACIVLNKMDLPEARNNFETVKREIQGNVLGISAKTGINLTELLRYVRVMYDSSKS